ncbi:EamA family transporter [Pleomorphomonas oryzae]|uniref:EamA family transporter n=1 Tax=Pleomorphomonas oryzae TaxID=261934 RepID=UPI0003F4C732|nr:EamA family transporter [Pleomorphomonas oryzae]
MKSLLHLWQIWALLSAVFAAATAILAKIGVEAIGSDLATLIRTAVVLALAALVVAAGDGFGQIPAVPGRTWLFLVLSGFATGASWLCYFRALKLGDAARVAPVDKLSVVFVAVFAVLFLGERLSPQGTAGVVLIAAGAMLVAWQ